MEKFSPYNQDLNENILFSRMPIIFMICLVYIGALVMQNVQHQILIPSIIFSFVLAAYATIYWFTSSRLFNNVQKWFYLVIQVGILFFLAFILPKGSPVVLIGLMPILIVQSNIILKNKIKVLIFFMFSYLLFCISMGVNYGLKDLPFFILIFFNILIIVVFYTIIYNRQVHARIRMEFYLKELELAYQKVEELTLINERQRMARDLHDTLAQGVAGLIMQLEAINVHLKNGNVTKTKEIIGKSMQHARETLKDSRTVIDNLRSESLERIDFHSALLDKIKKFDEITGIQVKQEINPIHSMSNLSMEYSLYILSEALTNITKHAQATKVRVTIKQEDNQLHIQVVDNGIGFDTKNIGKRSGKYGIVGLQERVRLLGGSLRIDSISGEGTELSIFIPI